MSQDSESAQTARDCRPRPPRGPAWRLVLLVGVAALIAGASAPAPAQAEETVRERLRQRMAERRAQRDEVAVTRGAPSNAAGMRPGTHEFTLRHDGLERAYLVHVPARHDPGRPAALVVAFHGGGGDARFMADDERYGLIAKSEQTGVVVAFPNGYSRFRRGKLATWNAGTCCGDARDRNVDDVGFVRAMLEQIGRRLDVDPGRVFATGMSNGGMLSHRLACEMADVFSAVGSVAGTDAALRCAPSRPISVLHIHARNDDHVLYDGGAGEEAFRDRSTVTEFVSVPDTVARWTARNQCDTTPVRTLSRPGAYCETYGGCAAGVQVQLCVTEAGGHSWPGAETVRRGKEPASQALSANDVIWAFFEANAR